MWRREGGGEGLMSLRCSATLCADTFWHVCISPTPMYVYMSPSTYGWIYAHLYGQCILYKYVNKHIHLCDFMT